MDPLSIAASIGGLSGACTVTLKRLKEVAGKFKDAPRIIQVVSLEARTITISLSLLHNTFVNDEHTILNQALLTPDIRNALDISLTGCSMTLSCIDNEIRSFSAKIEADQTLSFADRAKVVWKGDKFTELLQQLRGQHNAIAILQQGLQMYGFLIHVNRPNLSCSNRFNRKALADIVPLLKRNHAAIQKVAEGTESLRGLYPQVNAAKSFLESSKSSNRDEQTLSVLSETQFEFDDIVTDSVAYRRALAVTLKTRQTGNILSDGDPEPVDLGPEEGASRKETANLGTQGANQARKIIAATPMRAVGPSAPDEVSQNSNNRNSNKSDPGTFIQELRGYADCIEELLRAKDETANLQEMVLKKDNSIQRLKSQIQSLKHLARKYDNDLYKAEEQILYLHRDAASKDAELIAKSKELQSTTEQLHETQKEKDQHQVEYREREMNLMSEVKDLCMTLKKICTENNRRMLSEESIQKGHTTQFGTILLVPLQSPAWLDENSKRAPIFQAVHAPDAPAEDVVVRWDGEFVWFPSFPLIEY
jgi:hypothetical protein